MNASAIHSGQKSMEGNFSRPDFLQKSRHEIRSAMHVVVGMSKVLSMADTLTPQQKEIVATLKKNADRSLKLIDNMFDFLQLDGER
jgi:signal transduction histidine kinase